MNPEQAVVLLLEDCPVTGTLIERALMTAMPHVRLLWARGVDEATARVAGLPVELFLVDIGLPDGSGLDFLYSMSTAHPSARAIVMTATPLPEYQMHSAALGVLNFLEKPVNIAALLEQMRAALRAETTSGTATNDFRATLRNLTPVDILQLKCLTGATTVIEFRSEPQTGRGHVRSGEMVHAEVGALKGVDAVHEIVAWKRGQVSEQPGQPLTEATIEVPWQTVLMNAAQQLDEHRAVGF
jgi:DNA-binding NarL/FixJ family response regulator